MRRRHPSGRRGQRHFQAFKKIIGDAGYGDYYNHGLGHGVGIDIHELPNFNRSKNIIEVGSVITMEPGVYLPGVGGVRLEDYGVVTENGYEPLHQDPARPAHYRLLKHPVGFLGRGVRIDSDARVLFLCAPLAPSASV